MHNTLFSPRRWRALLTLLAGALLFAAAAQADPAGRIGRIAWLSGTVNLYNPNTGESFAAPLNQPLTTGDILTTEPGSRAEIQIGSMTVRLDSDSALELDRIDDDQVHLYLSNGRAIAKLPLRETLDDFELSTRNGRFNARDTGIYRFDADANSTGATVYYGALHFEANDATLDIGAGQSAQFWNAGQTRYRLSSAIRDDFTHWSAGRDQRAPANTYARYVSPEMTGAEDLDAYGNWSESPEYGAIWTPRAVPADWAPYRSGHWVWVDPWGWNWVGNEPWGFAPFHYGRWVQHRGAWGWVPGARVVRPVYAPAMVAWMGTPSVGVSIAIGARPTVGWFPLAPREVYVPAYRSSANYVRNVNITHVTRIENVTTIVNNPQAVVQQTHYAHREMPRAVTVVPADVVTHRRPVEAAVLSPRDQRNLREQPLQAAAPVAAPPPSPRSEPRSRQERPDQPFGRREREQPAAGVAPAPRPAGANQPVPAPMPQAPVASPQRSERPMPEIARPAPQMRTEPMEPRRQEAPAPLPAPQVETRNRQENRDRPGQPVVRQEIQPQAPVIAAPPTPAPAPAAQAPAIAPQRIERPMPEIVRPAPPPRPETSEPRRQEAPVPLPLPQAAPQIETRNRQEIQDRPGQPAVRQEIQPQVPVIAPPPPPAMRSPTPPPPAPVLAPAPQAPAIAPQRIERPMPEIARPAPPPRPEPSEPRMQERPARPPQPEMRAAPAPQPIQPAPPARVEMPPPMVREARPAPPPPQVAHPPEPRPEARTPPQDNRQRPSQEELDKRRQHKDEPEKR